MYTPWGFLEENKPSFPQGEESCRMAYEENLAYGLLLESVTQSGLRKTVILALKKLKVLERGQAEEYKSYKSSS